MAPPAAGLAGGGGPFTGAGVLAGRNRRVGLPGGGVRLRTQTPTPGHCCAGSGQWAPFSQPGVLAFRGVPRLWLVTGAGKLPPPPSALDLHHLLRSLMPCIFELHVACMHDVEQCLKSFEETLYVQLIQCLYLALDLA